LSFDGAITASEALPELQQKLHQFLLVQKV